jgi:hypothetical protein
MAGQGTGRGAVEPRQLDRTSPLPLWAQLRADLRRRRTGDRPAGPRRRKTGGMAAHSHPRRPVLSARRVLPPHRLPAQPGRPVPGRHEVSPYPLRGLVTAAHCSAQASGARPGKGSREPEGGGGGGAGRRSTSRSALGLTARPVGPRPCSPGRSRGCGLESAVSCYYPEITARNGSRCAMTW